MGADCTWLRYVDDVLVVVPEDVDLDEKLRFLNEVDEKIQFTIEREKEQKLPFLDTLEMRTGSKIHSLSKSYKQRRLRSLSISSQRTRKKRDCYWIFLKSF